MLEGRPASRGARQEAALEIARGARPDLPWLDFLRVDFPFVFLVATGGPPNGR